MFHFFFPNQCLCCKKINQERSQLNICGSCWNLSFDPGCVRIGVYECFSAGHYRGIQKKLIRGAKFDLNPYCVPVLEGQLVETYRRVAKLDYHFVTCVPGSLARLRARKIDLPYLLARKLSKEARLPFAPGLIRRTRDDKHQLGLGRDDRRRNLFRCFQAERNLIGKRILVIDDVYTTGSTCEAVLNSLYAADAQHVTLLVLARTPLLK